MSLYSAPVRMLKLVMPCTTSSTHSLLPRSQSNDLSVGLGDTLQLVPLLDCVLSIPRTSAVSGLEGATGHTLLEDPLAALMSSSARTSEMVLVDLKALSRTCNPVVSFLSTVQSERDLHQW
jgi:hypothetical protein